MAHTDSKILKTLNNRPTLLIDGGKFWCRPVGIDSGAIRFLSSSHGNVVGAFALVAAVTRKFRDRSSRERLALAPKTAGPSCRTSRLSDLNLARTEACMALRRSEDGAGNEFKPILADQLHVRIANDMAANSSHLDASVKSSSPPSWFSTTTLAVTRVESDEI